MVTLKTFLGTSHLAQILLLILRRSHTLEHGGSHKLEKPGISEFGPKKP